jgi:AcrR family transcriptional regulator
VVSYPARLPGYVSEPDAARTPGPARLSRVDRREALLTAAAAILTGEPVEAVTMDAVAERAGVSRPLVYKHFANRGELLAAVYQREAAVLHAELAASVRQAATVEDKFRALIRGALKAQADRGTALAALRAAGGWNQALRREQRQRDQTTVRYFAGRVSQQLGVGEAQATLAVSILLGAIETVLAQWRRRPTRQHAAQLEDAYVTLVTGGLAELAGPASPAHPDEQAPNPGRAQESGTPRRTRRLPA